MIINDYLSKQYPSPPCWALVAEVYATELGQGVEAFSTVNNSIRAIASAFRIALHKSPNGFKQIAEPVQFCIVLLGKSERLGLHHCGVYVDGKVLHAIESGNRYEEMSVIQDTYALVEWWAKA